MVWFMQTMADYDIYFFYMNDDNGWSMVDG